jgi:tetratricopeptide (TPR) repeat protein
MYIKYISAHQERKVLFYGLCFGFFILSLMSKPMAVTLPVVLIILDFYPLERLGLKNIFTSKRKVLIEKLPFFILGLLTSLLTLMAQQTGGSVATLETLSFVKRILIAIRALGFYLFKILWPLDLAPFYPYPPEKSILITEFTMAATVVFFITAFCIYSWRRQRIWSVVWAYYIVTLLPVLGIIKVGDQAAADRYTYLPSLGPFILIGLGISQLMRNVDIGKSGFFFRKMNGFVLIITIIFIFLVNLNIKQQSIWKASESLWGASIKQYPQSAYKAYNNLGYAYKSQGNIVKAIENYKIALKINPNFDYAHNNLGVALESQGHFDKAIEHYERAIKINPNYSWPYYNLGHIYQLQNQMEKAIEYYQIAIREDPIFSNAYYNLGQIYQSQGRMENAIKHYKTAIEFNPFYYDAYNNLGIVYKYQGFIDKAIEQYRLALKVKPDFKNAHMNIGFAYFKKGNIENAIYHLENAIKLDPNNSKAHLNLGIAYKSKGLTEEANEHFSTARKLNPALFKARGTQN